MIDPRTGFEVDRPADPFRAPPAPAFPWTSLIWGGVALTCFIFAVVSLPWLVESIAGAVHRGPERVAAEEARAALAGADAKSLGAGFELVAKAVAPSVVHINVRQRRADAPDEFAQLFPDRRVAGQGSGVIVDPSGYIVTNYHVVQGASAIEVRLSDGTIVPARRVGVDALFDLAVLKVNAGHELMAVPWGDSDALSPGAFVWALGSPFGLDHSVTFGIVSAKSRAGVVGNPYQDFLQTDAAVNPGNSGGPLVNIRGELVGINTAIVGPSFQGISFALPSNKAKKVYEQLKDLGSVARGWLGVQMRDATEDVAQRLGLPDETGVLIERVFQDTPAAKAGLRSADVIVEWDGKPTPNRAVLSRLVAETPIDQSVDMTIYRRGQKMSLKVQVGQRPEEL